MHRRLLILAVALATLAISGATSARAQEPDIRLDGLTFSEGVLEPPFQPDITHYRLSVQVHDASAFEGVGVTATAENPDFNIELDAGSITSTPLATGVEFFLPFESSFTAVHVRVTSEEFRRSMEEGTPQAPGSPEPGIDYAIEVRFIWDAGLHIDYSPTPMDSVSHSVEDEPLSFSAFFETEVFGVESMDVEVTLSTDKAIASATLGDQTIALGEPWPISLVGGTNEIRIAITDPSHRFETVYPVYMHLAVRRPNIVAQIADWNPDAVDWNTISAGGFAPGEAVTATMRSAPGGVELSRHTSRANDEGIALWDSSVGISIIVSAGMEVELVWDGGTVIYEILEITVEEADFESDIIRGRGEPGATIWTNVEVPLAPGEESLPSEVMDFGGVDPPNLVDESGHWEFDYAALGLDITPEMFFDIMSQRPSEQSHTVVSWVEGGVTEHSFLPQDLIASLTPDLVGVEGLGSGIEVLLEVAAEPGGEILFSDSQNTDFDGTAEWGLPGSAGESFNLDLQPGMAVSVAWGELTLEMVLDDLTIEEIDITAESVSGSAPENVEVAVLVGTWDPQAREPFEAQAWIPDVPVEQDGSWTADFSTQEVDITEGMAALALVGGGSTRTLVVAYAEIAPDLVVENIQSVQASDAQSVTVTTTASDGSVAEVEVPAAALPADTNVTVAAITNRDQLTEQVPPPADVDLAMAFRVNALGTDGAEIREGFNADIALSFTLDADTVPLETDAGDLVIAFWNGARWVAVDAVDIVENPDGSLTLTAQTDHLTVFGVFRDPARIIMVGSPDPLDEFALPVLAPFADVLAPPDLGGFGDDETGLTSRKLTGIIAGIVVVLMIAAVVGAYRWFGGSFGGAAKSRRSAQ